MGSSYKLAVIGGDGIGPEVTGEAVRAASAKLTPGSRTSCPADIAADGTGLLRPAAGNGPATGRVDQSPCSPNGP